MPVRSFANLADQPDEAARVQHILSHFPHLAIVPLSPAIAAEADRLRARYTLRTPDAIHLATAMTSGGLHHQRQRSPTSAE
ncbi:MAG: PIN domain-containing protein [Desulfuromonadales bacterium]|nr:PIN domain-containing protein [Desulfuromonadales bacterium]